MNTITQFLSIVALSAVATVANAQDANTPTTPAALPWDAAEIGVIYAADQDTYSDVLRVGEGVPASAWAPVTWGQTCVISDDEVGDGAAIRIDNLDFLPMQLPSVLDVTDYRYFHVEFWVATDCEFDVTLQHWWPADEKFVSPVYQMKAGQWNVIDLDLDQEGFNWEKKNEIPQHTVNIVKIGGENAKDKEADLAKKIWMTNVLFHNGYPKDTDGISELKANRSADNAIYNMAGQRVSNNYKGLQIVNGKKVMMK